MPSCRRLPRLSVAGLLGVLGGIGHGAIVVPTLISTPPANTDLPNSLGAGVLNMTNNSGLSAPLVGGESLATALTVTHVLNGTGHNQSWLTLDGGSGGDYFNGGATIEFIWDLGLDVVVDNLLVWNYGNDGGGATFRGNHLQDFTLQFNTAAEGSGSFTGGASTFTMFADTGTSGQAAVNQFATGPVVARYVRMELVDNYFNTAPMTGGGSRVGVGELRFDVSPVPEPSTLLLSALAVVPGLALRRRRRS